MVIGLYPYQIGGAEMQAREISIALKAHGHSIHYICYSAEYYASHEFDVHIVSARSKFDILYWGVNKRLCKALDDVKPDVVYHRAFVPYSRYIARWCDQHDVPFYFHSADIYTLIRKNDSIYNIVLNKWLSYTLKKASGVICQNKEQYEALRKYNLKHLEIIYNIQRSNLRPVNKNKDKNIVWIGKFESVKQPEIFVYLAEKMRDKDITFTMFSSKTPHTQENKELLELIKNNPRINLIEGKDNVFINEYLCDNAAVLVNTSVSEGISNTFIQAWMRGVPVVCLNSNPDNWLSCYQIGSCANGDKEKLAELIFKILDENSYRQYSENSIKFANDNFSPEVISPKLMSFMNIK